MIFAGLCAILLFVPLPIGSVTEAGTFAFEAATLVLFAGYMIGEARARRHAPPERSGIPVPVKISLGAFLALSIVQVVPLPAGLVKVLSPQAAAIYQAMARDGLAGWDGRAWWTLSLAPRPSVEALLLIVCYGLFAFLVLRTVRTRRRVETFVLVIIAAALFQAFYGMAETFSGSERIFGQPKKYGLGSVSGTFVNRNHFAGFMEMAFPLSLGYLLAKARYFAMERGLSLRRKILWFGQESLQWSLLIGLASVFIGLGLVFSKSRSGVMIFVATMVLAGAAIASWREFGGGDDAADGPDGRTRIERRRFRGIVRLVFAGVLGAALWIGVGPIVQRFADLDISREARRVFVRNTLEIVGGYPLIGTGKGTYLDAYSMYRDVDTGRQLSFAHNDYLETAAENGLPAAVCLLAAVLWLAAISARDWMRRRRSFTKGVGLGALLGVTAILIHGFTDFNLQIPANAVYFVGLCALAWNVSVRREAEDSNGGGTAPVDARIGPRPAGAARTGAGSPRAARPAASRATGLATPVFAALVALLMLGLAATNFLGYHAVDRYRAARSRVRSVQSGFPGLERELKRAEGFSGNPGIVRESARLYLEMAGVEVRDGNAERRDILCDAAVAAYTRVLARNPIDSFAQFEMGMAYLYYNYPLQTYAEKARKYFRMALRLNPSDEFLNLNILYLYEVWRDSLTAEERDWLQERLAAIQASDPAFLPKLRERWRKSFGKEPDLGSGQVNPNKTK